MAKDQTVSEFLLKRYDEDDYLAGHIENGAMHDGSSQSWMKRILADTAAKRRIVGLHGRHADEPEWCPT